MPVNEPVESTTPVASTNAFARLTPVADDVVALMVDPDFGAVGQYYEEFAETTDEEKIHGAVRH